MPIDIFTGMRIFTGTVKIASSVKVCGPFEGWVLHAIGAIPGVEARHAPDASLSVDRREHPLWVQVKKSVDAGSARLVTERFAAEDGPGLVIANSMTASARDHLEEAGIGYIDASGYMHVRAPGILIHVTASKKQGRAQGPTRLSGKAGLIAQVLLLEKPRRDWQIVELAEATRGSDGVGVSTGLIHKVLTRLEDAGLIGSQGSGPQRRRMVINAPALLDLLAEEDHERHVRRFPAYVYSPLPGSIAGMCSKRLDLANVDHAVTGVAAASLAVPALTTTPVTEIRIAAGADADAALSALSARPVDQGANCVLVQAPTDIELVLRRRERDTWLAAPTRIYLDALRDPRRGAEQAEAYRREVLAL